jgi:hypothetical protein
MKVTERFEVGDPLGQETRTLAANTYNRAQLLLAQSGEAALFVPIRSMQYLAVIEPREFIFVDGFGARTVELMWRGFRPGERESLEDPVPFEMVYFRPGARELMRRLHTELPGALKLLAERQETAPTGARVVDFKRCR